MFTLLRRLRARLKYRHFEHDLAREIEVHRLMKQEELETAGVAPADARSTSMRVLGNVTYMREEARSVWIARWMEQMVQDIRYAGRSLWRQAGFSLASIGTLALALGLLTSVFAMYSALYLRPWPVSDPDEVFIVTTTGSASGRQMSEGFSLAGIERLAAASATADFVGRQETTFQLSVESGQAPVSLQADWVSPAFTSVLKIPLQLGAGFDAGSHRPEVIISDRVWRNQMAGRADVVGSLLHLGRVPATVVGVLSSDFTGLAPRRIDLFANLAGRAAWQAQWHPESGCCQIIGRVRPSRTLADAAAEAAAIGPVALSTERTFKDISLTDTTMGGRPGGLRRTVPTVFGLLFAASVLVLVLACANVGNLHLARGLRRQRELAIRLSIGATRSRIVRQLLAESLSLTVLAAGVGLGVALVLPTFVMQFDRTDASYALSPDFRTYLFVSGITCLTCAMFGLAPALRVTRLHTRSGLTSVAQGAGRLRSIVLGTQVAVSAALAIAATLLVRGVVLTANTDGGFALKQVNVGLVVKPVAYDSKRNAALISHLERELNVIQGRQFALTETPPLSGRIVTVTSPGLPSTRVMTMSASSFEVLGVPVIAGRVYSDALESREVVVNAALADAAWPGQSPLGHTFDGSTVVGIAANARVASITQSLPLAFRPLRRSGGLFVTFRVDAEAEARVRQVLGAFDPRLTLRVTPASDEVRGQLDNSIIGASVAGGVGLLTLLLAIVGVFGVCAFIVEERRREIGIRLALGARRLDVRRTIVRAARWPLVGGLGCGLALAVLAGFLLRSFLLGVSPVDPASYAIVFALLFAAGVAATWLPMRRATRVDPAITLRHD